MIGIGVIVYNHTDNMGDYYQAAASMYVWWKFFKSTETFADFIKGCIRTNTMNSYPLFWIDRDRMNECNPGACTKIVTICNGWWMYESNIKTHTFCFPPPPFIQPIYTSIHLANYHIFTTETINHFKAYQPIGCRDKSTCAIMIEKGIDAYFSCCLTTILNLRDAMLGFNPTLDYSDTDIYVDVPINLSTPHQIAHLTQVRKYDKSPTLILDAVQSMINMLAAQNVFTRRLHVWLPLVSNNKPTTLLNSSYKEYKSGDGDFFKGENDRYTGIFELTLDTDAFHTKRKELMDDCLTKISVNIGS